MGAASDEGRVNFNLKVLTFFNLKLRTFRKFAPRLECDLPWICLSPCEPDAGSATLPAVRFARRADAEPITSLAGGVRNASRWPGLGSRSGVRRNGSTAP